MIMTIGTVLECRFSDGRRAEGLVTAAADGGVEARFEHGAGFEHGVPVEIRCVGEDGRAGTVAGRIERAEAGGVVAFALDGSPEPENERASYRVGTACAGVIADVGRQRDRRVLDVSDGGLSAEMIDAPNAGTVCNIALHAFGRTVRGRFVLRHARPSHLCAEGEVSRCGFQIAAGQPELARQMRDIVMEAQRAQLRNRSRLTGRSAPAMTGAEANTPDATADAPVETPADEAADPRAEAPVDQPGGDRPDASPATPEPSERAAQDGVTDRADGPAAPIDAARADPGEDAGEPRDDESGPAPTGRAPAPDGCARVRLSLDRVIGRPMPFSLRDAQGRIVVSRGETVDAGAAARIASSELEICEDWFTPDPQAKGAERRVCERRECHASIRVWLVAPDGARPVDGEMVDISRGGAGVRTRGVAHEGAMVIVEFRGGSGGWIVARVQSSMVTPGSAECRVGLRFLQSGVQHSRIPAPGEMRRVVEPFTGSDRQRRVQNA